MSGATLIFVGAWLACALPLSVHLARAAPNVEKEEGASFLDRRAREARLMGWVALGLVTMPGFMSLIPVALLVLVVGAVEGLVTGAGIGGVLDDPASPEC